MSSFSFSIVALAAAIAPGVLFLVSFFFSSSVSRTGVSIGPAADIAVFFSMSLILNGLYGGAIGWLAAHVFHPPCASLSQMIGTADYLLFSGVSAPSTCSTETIPI